MYALRQTIQSEILYLLVAPRKVKNKETAITKNKKQQEQHQISQPTLCHAWRNTNSLLNPFQANIKDTLHQDNTVLKKVKTDFPGLSRLFWLIGSRSISSSPTTVGTSHRPQSVRVLSCQQEVVSLLCHFLSTLITSLKAKTLKNTPSSRSQPKVSKVCQYFIRSLLLATQPVNKSGNSAPVPMFGCGLLYLGIEYPC